MDLFNKKKVKELKSQIEKLERANINLQKTISSYHEEEKDLNSKIDKLEYISSQTMEENQKLIKWIMTIIDTVGTMELSEKRQIQIPVYVEKIYKAYDNNSMGIFEKERITIPEITIIKKLSRLLTLVPLIPSST